MNKLQIQKNDLHLVDKQNLQYHAYSNTILICLFCDKKWLFPFKSTTTAIFFGIYRQLLLFLENSQIYLILNVFPK